MEVSVAVRPEINKVDYYSLRPYAPYLDPKISMQTYISPSFADTSSPLLRLTYEHMTHDIYVP